MSSDSAVNRSVVPLDRYYCDQTAQAHAHLLVAGARAIAICDAGNSLSNGLTAAADSLQIRITYSDVIKKSRKGSCRSITLKLSRDKVGPNLSWSRFFGMLTRKFYLASPYEFNCNTDESIPNCFSVVLTNSKRSLNLGFATVEDRNIFLSSLRKISEG
jgi:hypothetical protein